VATTVKLPIKILTEEAFYRWSSETSGYFGAYFAAAGSLFLYNAFLYLSLGYQFYLQYLPLVGTIMWCVALNYGFLSLFSDVVLIRGDSLPMFEILAIVAALSFLRNFLKIAPTDPKKDKYIKGLIVGFGVLGLLNLTPLDSFVAMATASSQPFLGVLAMVLGFKSWRQKQRNGLFFLIAAVAMCVPAAVWWIMTNIAGYPNTAPLLGLPLLGHVIAMTSISLGVGDHINTIIADKKEAEIKAQEGERNHTLFRVISHDLVNPLTVIQNFAAIHMKSEESADNSLRSWERVLAAAKHQQAMIEHIREMDLVISGRGKIALSPVDLNQLLQAVKMIFEKRLEDKKLRLELEVPSTPTQVLAEPTSLQNNVISNLVSNAIKFSPEGAVISVRVKEAAEEITVEVADRGVGMDAKHVANLFDINSSTSRVGTYGEKGTGFGMPIVKSYMDQYGGLIQVSSRPRESHPTDHGTVVSLKLKRAPNSKRQKNQAA
jgi:signal transduction histidine kinase